METVQQRKLFIGAISYETTEEALTRHFTRYGEVAKSEVIRHWDTGFGRGFGFVTFVDSSVVDQVLQDQHIILGRKVDVKLAKPKGENPQMQHCECQQTHKKKIFVGGLPHHISEEAFKKYFEAFGRVLDAIIIYDKENIKPRGFGFITYDSEEAVTIVLEKRHHTLNNKAVEVKKAFIRGRPCMDTCNYYGPYPAGYGWPFFDANGIYYPNSSYYSSYHYLASHMMMPHQTSSFSYLGTDRPVSRPVSIRYPVSYCAPTHNGLRNGGSPKSISHEGDVQDCNIDVKLVGKVSPRGTKSLENEADNGERENMRGKLLVNTENDDNNKKNGEKVTVRKYFQVNETLLVVNEASRNEQGCNIEDQLVGKVSPRAPRSAKSLESEANNDGKDHSGKYSVLNNETNSGEKYYDDNNASIPNMSESANETNNGEKDYNDNNCASIPSISESTNDRKDNIAEISKSILKYDTLKEMNGFSGLT